MHLLFLAFLLAQPADPAADRQPQLAERDGIVALVSGQGKSIRFALSPNAETFSPPVTVAELRALALGRHRGPRVAFAKQAILVTAIGGPQTADTLLAWRSTDQGKTWSQPITVNDVPAAAREGLHALAADAQGNALLVWLDLRATGTQLYAAHSTDSGQTWSKNFLVYQSPTGTICECCHPSVLALGQGEFAVMFRNALHGNRDMYVTRVKGATITQPAAKAGTESWALNACPMDGGGLAQAQGQILTAWRRANDIYLATPGQPETRLGEGKDVALAARGAKHFALWSTPKGIQAQINGAPRTLSQSGAYPTVVALPDGTALAAWEESNAITLRRLR
jgi:photosystem II stability/assembly factor-like uncharacterized protein